MKDDRIFLSGEVVHGKGIGHRFGFPTANILVAPKELPPLGVYASKVEVDGKSYNGVTNVGLRPTVDESEKVTVETWLDGLNEDIYGKTLQLTLVAFLRGTKKFDGIDLLKEQIYADREAMRKILG